VPFSQSQALANNLYNPVYKPRQVLCGRGQVVVVTGWTLKPAIAKHLEPDQFAAIGQLYSPTRGISFLLRNLLANPQVRFLVVLNATREDRNAGACNCLLDFFRNGFAKGKTDTGRDCWLIQSPTPGYIEAEIEDNALEHLRRSITWQEATSISQAVELTRTYAQLCPQPPWGEPLIFLQTATAPTTLPGRRYGHQIEGRTIAEAWVKIIHRIKTTGVIRPTAYDGQWQELIDLVAIVTAEPEEFYFPEPNFLPCDRAFIQDYIAQMLDDAPELEGVKYTYGQRLRSWFGRDQIQQVIEKLTADLDSARAVMSLWDVRDHDMGSSPPCLNHLWVRIVDQQLSLTATFRSNDMFSAWPANAMGLRALQRHICDRIIQVTGTELQMGPLITVSQSAHIYDDCWDNSDRVIECHYSRICQQRDYDDPAGSFVITLQNQEILVEHMTPGSGEVMGCFSGKSATHLYRQLALHCPSLEVEHALYLGTELQKAELALKQQRHYEQDKPYSP
jgi:thymidylate synthase